MSKRKNMLVAYKLFFGLLGLSALVTEVVVLVDRGTFNPVNFFSFFTVESNLFAAIVLLISAWAITQNKQSKHLDLFRGAATLYMVTTGIVFSLLLSGLDSDVLTAVPWDNTVLHYIMPVAVLVDWLIDPPKKRISFKRAMVWLLYPIVYVLYSLARGYIINWYPYPFLDPAKNGYAGVAVTSIGVTVLVLTIIGILVLYAKRKTP